MARRASRGGDAAFDFGEQHGRLDPFERDAQCVGQPRLLMPVHTHARVIERGHERRLQPVPPRGHLRRALVEPVGGERARRTEAADEQNILGARALTSLVPRAVHKLIQPRGGSGGPRLSHVQTVTRVRDVATLEGWVLFSHSYGTNLVVNRLPYEVAACPAGRKARRRPWARRACAQPTSDNRRRRRSRRPAPCQGSAMRRSARASPGSPP
mmetsp:Transcript_55186/g.151911  ORF Transcript_55186/g.151911 Transcript_55186/m.151911 type:complete len:212 (+) Transcript_55186:250-885(+)